MRMHSLRARPAARAYNRRFFFIRTNDVSLPRFLRYAQRHHRPRNANRRRVVRNLLRLARSSTEPVGAPLRADVWPLQLRDGGAARDADLEEHDDE